MATPVANSVTPPPPANNGTLTDEFIYGLVERGSWTFGGGPRLLNYSFSLGDGFVVELAMRYGSPSIASALDALRGTSGITAVPLYPQYAASSTGSSVAQ